MTIHIEELTFECIIGILDFERLRPQQVIINLQIDYKYKDNNFIDYAEVIAFIQDEMIENKYELLETSISQIIQKLQSNYSQITKLNLKITKPDIMSNAKVSLSTTFIVE